MLFNTLAQFADQVAFFNLFRYITFRTGGAMMTALIVSFICGPIIIKWLKVHQKKGQPIREDGPEGHLITKVGTPTMGGFMILLALVISTPFFFSLTASRIFVPISFSSRDTLCLITFPLLSGFGKASITPGLTVAI